MKIKSLLIKIWLTNIIACIMIYILYINFFMEPKGRSEFAWFEKFTNFFFIVVNYYFVSFFITVMSFSSISIFLNLIQQVQNNRFYSFLSFSGIPLFTVFYMTIDNLSLQVGTVLWLESPFIIIPLLYLGITILEFIVFQKKIKTLNTLEA